MIPFKLPDNFLFGTAGSTNQIKNNKQKIKLEISSDNSSISQFVNYWDMFDEDVNLNEKINSQTYLLTIEWGRVEPQKGVFNKAAIDQYRNKIIKLKKSGILPQVVLHHFSNPLWFENQNGWLNEESINLFERYTEYVVRNIGDLVSDWITINEPNVFLYNCFIKGIWYPEENNIFKYFKASYNLILSHIQSYKKIHEIRLNMNLLETNIGIVLQIRLFEPKKNNFFDKFTCKIYDIIFHKLFLEGMSCGKIIIPFNKKYPYGKGKYFDFLGIKNFSNNEVGFNINSFFSKIMDHEEKNKADFNAELFFNKFSNIIKKYFELYKIPIFILDDGLNNELDDKKNSFICNQLYQIKILIDEGVDLKRYYFCSLLDSFENNDSNISKYGLFKINLKDKKNIIRNSGLFYSEISKNKEIDQKMIDKYINKKRVFDILISEFD